MAKTETKLEKFSTQRPWALKWNLNGNLPTTATAKPISLRQSGATHIREDGGSFRTKFPTPPGLKTLSG